MMDRSSMVVAALGFLAAGCASGPPYIDQIQPEAGSMAVRRGQFEINCPTATGQVLSRESIPPAGQTFSFSGPVRDELALGVYGCGKRATYIVICPEDGSSCFAGGARNEIL